MVQGQQHLFGAIESGVAPCSYQTSLAEEHLFHQDVITMKSFSTFSASALLRLAVMMFCTTPAWSQTANIAPQINRINVGSFPSGYFAVQSDGTIEAEVSSSDFWNLQDHGMMVATEWVTGNFHIEAEVQSLDSERFPWAKAGIMMRASGNSAERSVGVFFTNDRGAVFQSRPVPGGHTSRVVADEFGSSGFVRVLRIKDTFYGAVSNDGTQWTSLGNFEWDRTPDQLLTGLAVAGQYDQPVTTRLSPPTATRPSVETNIYKLSLIDNASGRILRTFDQGDALDLNYYAGGMRVRAAVTAASGMRSMVFKVDGVTRAIDSSTPYEFDLSSLSIGEHTLEAIPHAGLNGAGRAFDSLLVDFDVNRGTPAGRPNIVYILADDMGFADCGFNGSQDVITPHLDSLAASGARCTSGYATCPQCGPSRAGILSGIHQYRFGYEQNIKRRGLPDPTVTPIVPEVLQGLGYSTAMIGKWHIGAEEDPDSGHREDWLTGIIAGNHTNVMPWMRGFDYTYSFNGGSSSYHPYTNHGKLFLTARGNNPKNLEVREGSTTPRWLNLNENTYQTTELTSRTISFIHRHRTEPFFVYLSYNAPHTPTGATDEEWEANDHILDPDRRELAGLMTGVDREVGRLMNYLSVQNLLENTIIFFLSDNGGAGVARNHSLNVPFVGGKGQLLEGGLRVPFLVSWKGQIPQSRDFDAPVMSIDYIATALQAQGVAVPQYMDSVPLLQDLQGKTQTLNGTPRVVFWKNDHRFARWGDFKYASSGSDNVAIGLQPYDIMSNVRDNVIEDPSAEPLSLNVSFALEYLLDDAYEDATDPENRDAFFSDP